MVKSTYDSIPIPNSSFHDHFFKQVAQYSDRIALVDGLKKDEVNFGELMTKVKLLSEGLQSLGLQKGDIVGLCAPSSFQYVYCMFGAMCTGACISNVNPNYTPYELSNAVRLINSRWWITTRSVRKKLLASLNPNNIRVMIIIDDDSDEDDDNDDEDGCILLASLLSSASRPSPTLQFSPSSKSSSLQSSPPPSSSSSSSSSSSISDLPHKLLSPGDVDPLKDAALILFSSGTTGPPKAVLLSHHNLVAMMVLMSHVLEPRNYNNKINDSLNKIDNRNVVTDLSTKNVSENQPVCLLFYPLFHIYGLVGILLHSLYRGHKLVILPKFSLADMFKCIELHKVTMLYLVPSLVNRMIKNSEMKRDYNLSSIKFVSCGAGPLTEQSCVEFKRLYNIEDVRQGYGMTESCLASLLVDPNLPLKIGSVGHPLPNSEVVVRSLKTGETFGPNKTGEICVRGPQVMLGYLNNQRATNETIDQDGWLHTGDVGYYDDDGYFFIVDRIKELIKVNGYQVSPAELESIILTHPSVSDCAVAGISDNRGGEIPKAFVVKKPGYDVSAENIVNLVADHTSAYKHLKGGVCFLERLPKNEAGKILRRRLKDLPRSKL